MELKVWVEGIQRVVCGITEQTTVQEVVIALAQATGRTGRYTLVEKWRENEKLLPPSEHPVKVLEKWGEYASDVQFLLKRTGASTTSDAENSKAPERNVYRQSLPPAKKNDISRSKRKPLTITGSGSNSKSIEESKKQHQNSNGNNNRDNNEVSARYDRSGSVPADVRKAAHRFSANIQQGESPSGSSKGSKSKDKSKSKGKPEKKTKDEPRPKSALMPPHMQNPKSPVGSATKALFPTETESEVVAKSPTRKVDPNKNAILRPGGKVALMPPTHKLPRNRNSSSASEQMPLSPTPNSSGMGRTRNTGAMTPTPFSSTGNGDRNSHYRHGNSLPRKKKNAWSESISASVDDGHRNFKDSAKKPMMPPGYRMRSMTPNPRLHNELYSSAPISLPIKSNHADANAIEEFTRLVREQQSHIEKQKETVNDLDNEIKKILDEMQQQEQDVEAKIAKFEEKNRALEMQYVKQGYGVTEELSAEESKVNRTQQELKKFQEKIDRSSTDINAYKRKMDELTKALNEETQLQRIKQQRAAENERNIAIKSKKDIEHINWKLSSLEEEIKNIEKEITIRDGDINYKNSSLENLNRELRQVNLQQFIRKTGSKVTVLPPETGSPKKGSGSYYDPSNLSGTRSPLPPTPTSSGNSEGVWV